MTMASHQRPEPDFPGKRSARQMALNLRCWSVPEYASATDGPHLSSCPQPERCAHVNQMQRQKIDRARRLVRASRDVRRVQPNDTSLGSACGAEVKPSAIPAEHHRRTGGGLRLAAATAMPPDTRAADRQHANQLAVCRVRRGSHRRRQYTITAGAWIDSPSPSPRWAKAKRASKEPRLARSMTRYSYRRRDPRLGMQIGGIVAGQDHHRDRRPSKTAKPFPSSSFAHQRRQERRARLRRRDRWPIVLPLPDRDLPMRVLIRPSALGATCSPMATVSRGVDGATGRGPMRMHLRQRITQQRTTITARLPSTSAYRLFHDPRSAALCCDRSPAITTAHCEIRLADSETPLERPPGPAGLWPGMQTILFSTTIKLPFRLSPGSFIASGNGTFIPLSA